MPSRLRQAFLVGLAVAAFSVGFEFLRVFRHLELKSRDLRMGWTRPPRNADGSFGHPEIAIIDITDQSIQWLADESRRPWPWPREVFGFMERACTLGKAKAVLFDLFTHIDKDYLGTEPQWEKDIRSGPPTYLATPFSRDPVRRADARKNLDELLKRYEIAVENDGSVEIPSPYASVLLPQPAIAEAVAGVCDVSTPRDREDEIIRRYRLLSRFRDRYYPSFALAGLMVREGVKTVRIRDRVLTVGKISFPVEKDGTVHLRYYYPFTAMPASNVISGLWSIEDDKKVTTFDPSKVENRIVLIGTSAAGLFDNKATPVGELPGTVVHAMALRNVLEWEFMREAPPWVRYSAPVMLAILTALMTRFASAAVGGGGVALLLAGAVGASFALFKAHWIVDLVVPVVAILLGYAATSAVNFLYEGRQRLRVKREFQRYLSPKVVEKILKQPDALHLEGERKTLTIFFLDFAGFTSMSEKLDPSELVKLVSDYHNEAAEEIFRTEGTIDKYIGDAIMAFWNDPIDQADHALRACLSAVGAQKRLKEMARGMKARGLPEMQARIGINTGIATVGNMGARYQVNYTLMGDEVNLASRLEGVNKEFGTDVIVSEATYLPAKDRVDARELALIKVKGKKLPVRIFELIALKGETPPARMEAVRRFESALADFRARRFDAAGEAFRDLAKAGDPASNVYAGLCERYRSEPPPADWDGSYQMEHK